MYLKIEGCGKCPHVGFFDSSEYSAECRIKCLHPDQSEDIDVMTVKIRNVDYNVYFKCPLNNQSENEN